MSQPVLALNNSANWTDVWSNSFTAAASSVFDFEPIPEVTVPVLFDSHIVAVYVGSTTAKPTWNFGGLLTQRISLGLTVGGGTDADVISKRKLWLRSNTLFLFPHLTPEYALRIVVPKWFSQVSFVVWVYTGPVGDTTEELIKTVQLTANEINAKL